MLLGCLPWTSASSISAELSSTDWSQTEAQFDHKKAAGNISGGPGGAIHGQSKHLVHLRAGRQPAISRKAASVIVGDCADLSRRFGYLSNHTVDGNRIHPSSLRTAMTFYRKFPQGESFPMRQQQSERYHRGKCHQPQQDAATRS